MGHIARLVVGRVEIVDSTFETGVHNRQILIRKSDIDDELGLVAVEKLDELFHRVGVDAVGGHVRLVYLCGHGVALRACARSDYYLTEHLRVLGAFMGYDGAHSATADDDDFCHFSGRG